jgi:hypothetical protein
MRRSLLLVLTSLLLSVPCLAQTLGTIAGEIRDSSGALVPGVSVTVTNKATNATRTTFTNAVGLYDLPALPPGAYLVKSELDGFKTATRDVELRVQQTVRVNFTLELGTIAEMATVVGVSPLVETSNATIGTVIENRRIVELPLNGRNYLQLVALSPNVSAEFAGAGQAGARQGGTRSNQQLSISGQRREFNNYTLDGVDNTDVNFNTYIFLPSVDALEEFKVQTGVYSAEFGRGASQVNVVTKSGTNNLHGTIFEFHRDDALDARPYAFTPAQAVAPKAPFKWDQYGYTAGGPVWRNRLFYMSNFEGYRDRKQFQNPYSLPSTAMRRGDFSELLRNLGPFNAQTGQLTGIVVDPTQCTVVGTTRTCAPFPGNIIPANRIDSTSSQLLEFYPEPNNGSVGLVNNHLALQDRKINKYQYTQRMDVLQSAAMTWMGRYSYANENEVFPALKLNGTKLDTRVHQAALGNTWTMSSTVVNEFRFGYNYFFNTFGRELAFERDVIKELNIPGISLNPPEAWGIPSIGITGFSGFGDSTEGPYTNRNHAMELNDNLTWIQSGRQLPVRHVQPGGQPVCPRQLPVSAHRHRLWVRRLPARLPTADRIGRGARGDEVPGGEPVVLLHRYVAALLRHDAGSRPALRIHAAVARQERHADECGHSVPRHDTKRAESRLPSDARAHRQRRRLREHRAALRAEHSGGARRPARRSAGLRRQKELRAAARLGLDPDREDVVPCGHRYLLHAGHRQPALRHGAQPVGTPS